MNYLFLWFVKLTALPLALLYYKLRVICAPNKFGKRKKSNPKGRTLFISNHLSLYDPVPIYLAYPFRTLRCIVSRHLFWVNPWLKLFLRMVGAVPAERGEDLSAVAKSIELLEKEKNILFFPEGKLSTTGETLPFQLGAAAIAVKTDPAIVPIFHVNRRGWTKRSTMVIGKEFKLSEHFDLDEINAEKLREITEFLRERILELKELIPKKIKK